MEKPTWKSQIDAEAKRKIQAEKVHAEDSRFQISPEALERNRQRDLRDKRVGETLQGMVIFNTDIVPILSSFNQEVWGNLGTISKSSISAEKPKFITLTHASTVYSGKYVKEKRTQFGRYGRSVEYSSGGEYGMGGVSAWSQSRIGFYTEVGRRLVKINESRETDSISIMLGYSDMTELFELRVKDSKVDIEPDGFTEFPDKRRLRQLHPPAHGYLLYDDSKTGIVAYQKGYGRGADIYDIAYEQLYRDPTISPAGDFQPLSGYYNHYEGERYKKVPFNDYTLISDGKNDGQIAIFFNKNNVDKSRIQKFLEQALVVSSANRKAKGKLPQDIEQRNNENLKQLQSMLNKKDFSASHIEWR